MGTILGPVIGGALAESSATWRWAFYLNLCVAALCAPVYLFLLPSHKPRAGTKALAIVGEYDFIGTILIVGALVTLFMGLNFGGVLYPWNSRQIIALFVVSAVLFILFGVQQTLALGTSPTTRIFPVQFLRRFDYVVLFVCVAASNCACFIPIYYIPLYFQFTRDDGAIDAAVRLLPYIFVLSVAILGNGHLMGRFSYFQPWYIGGGILTLVGAVLLCKCACDSLLSYHVVVFWSYEPFLTLDPNHSIARITSHTPQSQIYGYEFIVGLGTGACAQAGYAVIQSMVEPAETAYAISFMMLG